VRPRAVVLWSLLFLGLSLVLHTGLGLARPQVSGNGAAYLPILQRSLPPTATVTRTSTPSPTATASETSWAEQVVTWANVERVRQGLAPLRQVPELMRSAALHSQDMASHDFMGHTGSDGSTPGDRMHRAGYDWHTYGENVAAGYGSPASVVAGWMASPGHRANILNPSFEDVGAGYCFGNESAYGHYWTLNLGAR